jgi:IS30 family transposase
MAPGSSSSAYDHMAERHRAVALSRHSREAEGLSIAQIADRLGRSPAMIKAHFLRSTGEKARAVMARYQGVCRGCGAYTQPRNASKSLPLSGVRQRVRASGQTLAFQRGVLRLSAIDQLVEVR